MEEDLATSRYPGNVLNEAVLQARRTLEWYPSIRAMIAICEQLIEPRRREYRAIWQMKAEHARRQQEAAEREARAAEDEARRQAKIRWLRGLEERARERFGNDAPLPGDIELADAISNSRHTPWPAALERGEPWAANFCRLMALAEGDAAVPGARRPLGHPCNVRIGTLARHQIISAAISSAIGRNTADSEDFSPQKMTR
jgi:hypothetical protein